MIAAAALLGAGIGLGLWLMLLWAVPPRPSLASALAAIRSASRDEPVLSPADAGGWVARAGRPGVRVLAGLGLPSTRLAKDLAVVGCPAGVLLAKKAALTVGGLLLPGAVQVVFWAVGVPLPWQFPLIAALVCGGVGFLLPDLRVRQRAAARRASFRHALSAYLNLVRMSLAGGAGVDGALTTSATVGHGWAFSYIRRALTVARITRATPWTTLRQLGEELDVRELVELAAAVSLAGTEGAKVRVSLAAKAAALRVHELTESEGAAKAATERMALPVVCLFAGFLLFIGFPAVAAVLAAL